MYKAWQREARRREAREGARNIHVYVKNIGIESRRNRAALESSSLEFHFLRAKNHRKRATRAARGEGREGEEERGDTNSPHLSFKLDFSSAILAARARITFRAPSLWSDGLIDLAWNAPLTFCRLLVRIVLLLSLSPLPRSVPISDESQRYCTIYVMMEVWQIHANYDGTEMLTEE